MRQTVQMQSNSYYAIAPLVNIACVHYTLSLDLRDSHKKFQRIKA